MSRTARKKPTVFNFQLTNLPGEKWKGLPGREEYTQVSNFGRVRSLPRVVTTVYGVVRYMKMHMHRSTLIPKYSFRQAKYRYQLNCTIRFAGKQEYFNPVRLVYHLFCEPFPFDDPKYSIDFLNGDDLDIRPDNLVLIYKENPRDVKRVNPSKGMRIQYFKKLVFIKAVIERRRNVSRYNQSGKLIDTYPDLQCAAESTGLRVLDIHNAIRTPFTIHDGYYWRSGKERVIDVSLIKEDEERRRKEALGQKITQFDLNGVPINFFLCTEDAAKHNHISIRKIERALDVPGAVAGYFFWKKGWIESEIPGL